MAMNGLDNLLAALKSGDNEILVDAALAERALLPLERMVNFRQSIAA